MNKKIRLLTKKEITEVLNILENTYTDAMSGLVFNCAYELTIALILAAQCTDERVNIIRPMLTDKYKDFFELHKASQEEIYAIIKSCSFPNNKAKHILNAAKYLVENYNGEVPSTMEELIKIPGIGRKSANLILASCFNYAVGIAVDTHVKRLSKRIGFTNQQNVLFIEKDLMKKVPNKLYLKMNHILVNHGKSICKARKPSCDICPLNNVCKKNI